jgi:hypothetical protein
MLQNKIRANYTWSADSWCNSSLLSRTLSFTGVIHVHLRHRPLGSWLSSCLHVTFRQDTNTLLIILFLWVSTRISIELGVPFRHKFWILTRPQSGRSLVRFRQWHWFVCCPKTPDRLCSPPNLLFNGQQKSGLEADLQASRLKVDGATHPLSPRGFVACIGKILSFLFWIPAATPSVWAPTGVGIKWNTARTQK